MNKKELKRLVDEKHTYSICGGKETVDKKTGKTKVSRYHTRLDNGTQVYASRRNHICHVLRKEPIISAFSNISYTDLSCAYNSAYNFPRKRKRALSNPYNQPVAVCES